MLFYAKKGHKIGTLIDKEFVNIDFPKGVYETADEKIIENLKKNPNVSTTAPPVKPTVATYKELEAELEKVKLALTEAELKIEKLSKKKEKNEK